jgi:hypothetical protein
MRKRKPRASGPKNAPRPKAAAAPRAEMSTYIFTFELMKQYPTVRSFIIKQPLRKSFRDTFSELLGGAKK